MRGCLRSPLSYQRISAVLPARLCIVCGEAYILFRLLDEFHFLILFHPVYTSTTISVHPGRIFAIGKGPYSPHPSFHSWWFSGSLSAAFSMGRITAYSPPFHPTSRAVVKFRRPSKRRPARKIPNEYFSAWTFGIIPWVVNLLGFPALASETLIFTWRVGNSHFWRPYPFSMAFTLPCVAQ